MREAAPLTQRALTQGCLKTLNSVSWKITKPLRFFKKVINLYRKDGIIFATKKVIKKILRK